MNTQPAIIVDWEHVNAYEGYDEWLAEHDEQLAIILIVPDPENNDYDFDAKFEPAVVLRNSLKKPMPLIAFKTTAVLTVQESSNMIPVVAWDDDADVIDMYRAAGVPVTTEFNWQNDYKTYRVAR